jgi:hypothetical protein
MPPSLRLIIGTRKAAFIYTANEPRSEWEASPPILPGWSIYHAVADTRDGTPRLYAAASHPVWGPSVAKSFDGGATWDQRSEGLGFPADMGLSITTVWYVTPGLPDQPGVVYAGASPAGLFRSDDWGHTWKPNDAINRHDFRAFWQPIPGGPATPDIQRVGSALHSIQIDPRDRRRIYIVNSGGGSYVTEDEGATWKLFSQYAGAFSEDARVFVSQTLSGSGADADPASFFDMHRLKIDPGNPDHLWAQSHIGVFRSVDRGDTWEDVSAGLPSFHGFPVTITRRAPGAVFVVPLAVGSDNFRVCEGQLAVYRTRDDGQTWDRLTYGLPGPIDYQSVYREAMDTDALDPEGIYLGTSNGQLYSSFDQGESWQRLPGTLPPILSVATAVW